MTTVGNIKRSNRFEQLRTSQNNNWCDQRHPYMNTPKAKSNWPLQLVAKRRRASLTRRYSRFLTKEKKQEVLSIFRENGNVLSGETLQRHKALVQRCTDLEIENERLRTQNERLNRIVDEKLQSELSFPTITLKRLAGVLIKVYSETGGGEPPDLGKVRRDYSEWVGQLPGARGRGRPRKDDGISLSQAEAYRFSLWFMREKVNSELTKKAEKILAE
jgi:hypothetical protein